jgi:transcriptional regulator NrdR family protein
MGDVIKKNGKKERFNEKKLKGSVQKAAISAGIEVEEKAVTDVSDEAIDFFKNKSETKTDEIKMKLLKDLDEIKPSVSDAWRRFDAKYKD